jgi:hypothetical protein
MTKAFRYFSINAGTERRRPGDLLDDVVGACHASKDQAAATARIPPLTLVLNTATLIITAVLGMAIGVLIMVLHQTQIDQEHAKRPEARLARDLATIGGSIDYDVFKTAARSDCGFFRAEPGSFWVLNLIRRVPATSRFTTQLGEPTRVSNTDSPGWF